MGVVFCIYFNGWCEKDAIDRLKGLAELKKNQRRNNDRASCGFISHTVRVNAARAMLFITRQREHHYASQVGADHEKTELCSGPQ